MTHISPLSLGWKVTAPGRELRFKTRREALNWAKNHVQGMVVVHGKLETKPSPEAA